MMGFFSVQKTNKPAVNLHRVGEPNSTPQTYTLYLFLYFLVCIWFVFYPLLFSRCPSCLRTSNPIPANHRVINDHLFPDDYGWLPLTFTSTQTDNWTWMQQIDRLLQCSRILALDSKQAGCTQWPSTNCWKLHSTLPHIIIYCNSIMTEEL